MLAIDASGELVWSHVHGQPRRRPCDGRGRDLGRVFVHGEFFSKLTHQGGQHPGGNGKTNVF